MDRVISKEERRRAARKIWTKAGIAVAVVAVGVAALVLSLRPAAKESDMTFSAAEVGMLESSVSASGRIVPLHEQIIVSPVSTQLMEVYCDEGDAVEAGQSLLRLDLHAAESDLRRMRDEAAMKGNDIEQTAINNSTYITDLEMRIKAKEMALEHLRTEVANERRLDSIGSGTGERIRQAELAYSTARLELDQMKVQLKNERKSKDVQYQSKRLEGNIVSRNIQEMERTMEDAKVKAPITGVVTWLNKNIGVSIGAGEKLAVVSDLSHFKINGEIPEGNAGKLSIGARVKVRVNRDELSGRISNLTPQSEGGMVKFTVIMDDDSDPHLRSGLKTDLNVIYDERDEVLRIRNGSYFSGPGTYDLFVRTSPDHLEKRSVILGESNFDYVEVISGLAPGDQVAVGDMTPYKSRSSLSLK